MNNAIITAEEPDEQSLTPAEIADLDRYEHVIEQGMATFVQVAKALQEILRGKLYRESYATFEEYCLKRWGFSRGWAYKQIAAAEVVANVDPGLQLNVTQARELAPLTVEEQRELAPVVAGKTARETRTIVRDHKGIQEESFESASPRQVQRANDHKNRLGRAVTLIQASCRALSDVDLRRVSSVASTEELRELARLARESSLELRDLERVLLATADRLEGAELECSSDVDAMSSTAWRCSECEELFDAASEELPLYECSNCGDAPYTREDSHDGDSNRCPTCNKFGSLLTHHGCPTCERGELVEGRMVAGEFEPLPPPPSPPPKPRPRYECGYLHEDEFDEDHTVPENSVKASGWWVWDNETGDPKNDDLSLIIAGPFESEGDAKADTKAKNKAEAVA